VGLILAHQEGLLDKHAFAAGICGSTSTHATERRRRETYVEMARRRTFRIPNTKRAELYLHFWSQPPIKHSPSLLEESNFKTTIALYSEENQSSCMYLVLA
jgi:hypothetical protein